MRSGRSNQRSRLLDFGVAILSVAVALGLTLLLEPWLSPSVAPLFLVAVMISAWLDGWEAGLLATVLSTLVISYFWVAPRYSLQIFDIKTLVQLGLFAVASGLISWLSQSRHRALADAQANYQTLWETREREAAAQTRGSQTEEALRQSEARLQAVAANLPQGAVFVVDRDLRYLLAEGQAIELAGMTSEDLVGKTIWEALDPTLANFYEPYFRQALNGEPFSHEHDSHDRQYISHGTPLVNDQGEVYAALAVSYDITERKRAEATLHESEAKYRSLFESIDEGFNLLEMMLDEAGNPCDFRILETNPSWEQQTGFTDATGKTLLEIAPAFERQWIDFYSNVVLSGKAARTEYYTESVQRWYSVFASRVGSADSHQVAVVFNDITVAKHLEEARKRREANLAFLAEIQNACARLTSADEMMQAIGEKIGSYLNLAICAFVDIDEAQDQAIVYHHWHRADAPNLTGTYRISEFVTEAFYTAARAGETVIVNDTNTDVRTNAETCAALNVQAFIHVPFLRDGQWKFLFNGYDSRSRQWRGDDIELFRELANQIFPRLERTRAEEVIAADLRDTQLLQELGARLVTEGDIQMLYQEIMSTAIVLTRSNAGTVQILDEATQYLLLLATHGFGRNMTEHFWRVNASSNTACGMALRNGNRTFVDFDVPEDEDPDGSCRMHVEAGYLSAQSTPLITRSGKAIGMVSTHWREHHRPSDRELRFLDLLACQAADLIEQRQFEQALRQSESRFRLMVESAKEYAIFTLDLNGIVTSWNTGAEGLLGYSEAEIVGCDGRIIFTPEDDERGDPDRERQLALTQGRAANERWHVRKDGSRFWGSGLVSPLQNEVGTTQGFIKIMQDKTAERQNAAEREQLFQREQAAREEAERANRIKDEFLAVLSHEPRSPLNPILGWTKLLQAGNLDAAKTTQAITTIERNAKLQSELIEDLLDVSRILQGKLSLNASPVDLAATIQGAIETVRLAAEAKSITVATNLDSEVGKVSGDATRLQQVVWNLLSNAVKFTPTGGQVEVSLEQVDHHAQITVSDNGKGIPASFLPYVFDYFRQEDGATTRKFGGLGLGLAIVRHLVELHGGTVAVASEGEELGATFVVKLPLLKTENSELRTEDLALNPQPSDFSPLEGLQILVIDDEPDSREFVAFVLEQAGASVRTATTASEGFVALTQSLSDVLISDIGMPDMDGYMLMRQVRALPPEQGGQVKAIALTAYAGDFNQQQALQVGFQQHVSKPVEPEALVKTIRALLTG